MKQASTGTFSYLIAAILMLMNMQISIAVNHVVGDDRGWDPLSDFPGWTSRNIFRVGDNLWFAYATAQQSVLELKSAEGYERCDQSNPIKVYNKGLDAVSLVEAGTRYFTSGRLEDCKRGMKLRVTVLSDGIDHVGSDFDLISDGMKKSRDDDADLDLISVGMEKGSDDDADLVSDGVKKTANNFNIFTSWLPSSSPFSWLRSSFPSSWFSYLSSRSSFWATKVKSDSVGSVRMMAAEGPTSGSFGYSSYLLRSSSLRFILSCACCLVTIILY